MALLLGFTLCIIKRQLASAVKKTKCVRVPISVLLRHGGEEQVQYTSLRAGKCALIAWKWMLRANNAAATIALSYSLNRRCVSIQNGLPQWKAY
jgi:hypothetical protein